MDQGTGPGTRGGTRWRRRIPLPGSGRGRPGSRPPEPPPSRSRRGVARHGSRHGSRHGTRAHPAHPRHPRHARPQLLGPRAGHPPGRGPRRARGVALATGSPGSSTRSWSCSPPWRTTPARSAGAAASSRGCGTAPGPATSRSTSRWSSRTSPGTDVRHGKTRGTGEYGRYNVIFEYREEQVGPGGRPHGRGPRQPPRGARGPGPRLRHHRGAGEPDPPGGAPRLRPVHAVAPGRGRQPRHPVHPPGPVQPGPAGPGRPPAADPRHDDQPDERHRGGHRVGQEAHEPPAGLRRHARAALRGGDDRGRGRRRSPAPGLPVRGQAAGRQPRPGRRPGPPRRGRRPRAPSRRRCARAARGTSSSRATSPAATTGA